MRKGEREPERGVGKCRGYLIGSATTGAQRHRAPARTRSRSGGGRRLFLSVARGERARRRGPSEGDGGRGGSQAKGDEEKKTGYSNAARVSGAAGLMNLPVAPMKSVRLIVVYYSVTRCDWWSGCCWGTGGWVLMGRRAMAMARGSSRSCSLARGGGPANPPASSLSLLRLFSLSTAEAEEQTLSAAAAGLSCPAEPPPPPWGGERRNERGGGRARRSRARPRSLASRRRPPPPTLKAGRPSECPSTTANTHTHLKQPDLQQTQQQSAAPTLSELRARDREREGRERERGDSTPPPHTQCRQLASAAGSPGPRRSRACGWCAWCVLRTASPHRPRGIAAPWLGRVLKQRPSLSHPPSLLFLPLHPHPKNHTGARRPAVRPVPRCGGRRARGRGRRHQGGRRPPQLPARLGVQGANQSDGLAEVGREPLSPLSSERRPPLQSPMPGDRPPHLDAPLATIGAPAPNGRVLVASTGRPARARAPGVEGPESGGRSGRGHAGRGRGSPPSRARSPRLTCLV